MTELEQAAQRAYLALLHDVRPMPADVALDMVQDYAGGDRSAALAALLEAIAGRLRGEMPESDGRLPSARSACWVPFDIAAGALLATDALVEAVRAVYRPLSATDLGAAWLRWCGYADRAIEIARRLAAAATVVRPGCGARCAPKRTRRGRTMQSRNTHLERLTLKGLDAVIELVRDAARRQGRGGSRELAEQLGAVNEFLLRPTRQTVSELVAAGLSNAEPSPAQAATFHGPTANEPLSVKCHRCHAEPGMQCRNYKMQKKSPCRDRKWSVDPNRVNELTLGKEGTPDAA